MGLYFKVGLIRQRLAHGLSKYSLTEFMTGVRYLQGARSSNAAEYQELGYFHSWLHHKERSCHHYEYWMDVDKKHGWVSLKMPLRFVLEIVYDHIAAFKTYSGQDYIGAVPLGYYLSRQEGRLLHPETRVLLKKLLYMPRDKREHYTLGCMRWPCCHPALYRRREQPVRQ